jgi:hypothetical protein
MTAMKLPSAAASTVTVSPLSRLVTSTIASASTAPASPLMVDSSAYGLAHLDEIRIGRRGCDGVEIDSAE